MAQDVIKDRSDPTFYDGWDDQEFEWGMAIWPKPGEVMEDRFSIGQYIWHPAAQVTRAIPPNVDDEVPLANATQKYDPNANIIVSKYFDEDGDGDEYVYNFQRIRYVEAWSTRKYDPLFRLFTHEELHEDVIPAHLVLQQVLNRVDEQPKQTPDIMTSLESALSAYIGSEFHCRWSGYGH